MLGEPDPNPNPNPNPNPDPNPYSSPDPDATQGEPACDVREHPLWPAQASPPLEPADLSLWLAARYA